MRIRAWSTRSGRTQRHEADNDDEPKDLHRHGTDTSELAAPFHDHDRRAQAPTL